MWAQLSNTFSDFGHFLPWVSFAAGLGGSLHCVGMCGGLVAATCHRSSEIARYQLGRLIGYVVLGALAGALGGMVRIESMPLWSKILPALIVGGLFIYWGWLAFRGKRAELPLPRFFQRSYQWIWLRVQRRFPRMTKSFFTGLISIMLPCGLLYGVIAATVALENPLAAMVSMAFFWLGTLPAMVLAPGLFQRVLRPLSSHRPKIYAIGLMTIGVLTIGVRVVKQVEAANGTTTEKIQHSCH